MRGRNDAFRARLPVVIALLSVACAGVAAAYQNQPIHTDPKSGVEIQVGLPMTDQPRSGFIPLHLGIHNDTDAPHVWALDFRSNGSSAAVHYRTAIALGAHQRREFDLLVPWPTLDSVQPGYQSIDGVISGAGVVNGMFHFNPHYGTGVAMSMIAIAEPLGTPIWPSLEPKLKGGGTLPEVAEGLVVSRFGRAGTRGSARIPHGSPVRLDELPADARAFSGLAGLWVSDADWRAQPGAKRDAIRQWVMDGGRLFIAGESTSKLPGLPAFSQDMKPLGFGEIRRLKLSGTTLGIDETARWMLDLDSAPVPPWDQDFSANWALRRAVGEPQMNVPLLIIFVVAFGVLVGPVNLLVLAPPEKRYRLFFTVPLLSAGASVLLLGLIAFGDGLGGDGARTGLLLVSAGENRLSLYQEQMVRTRLLFQRSFQLPETVAASYIGNTVGGDPDDNGTSDQRNVALVREGTTLSGDWFRTRAVQGLFLHAAIPSRGEVVLRPGATPELLSTLASTLRQVHYVDAAGKYWVADELSTGRPEKLRAGTENEFATWSEGVAQPFSRSLRAQFEAALRRPGYFYAEATPSDENTIPTLRSIRWKDQLVVCLGPCTAEAAP